MFDLASAKERVGQELQQLTEEVWPDVKELGIFRQDESPNPQTVSYYRRSIHDPHKRRMFEMLWHLSTGCFWHAPDHWKEIAPRLSPDDQNFYPSLMIELARSGPQETSTPIDQWPHCWVVEVYDQDIFPGHISEEVLVEAVTLGFGEFAQCYFSRASAGGLVAPGRVYEAVMKYSDRLDLGEVARRRGKPLYDCYGWLAFDEGYLASFERARPQLSAADGAWLVRPVIDGLINRLVQVESGELSEPSFAKHLLPYSDYLGEGLIQDLFKEKVASQLAGLASSMYLYEHWQAVKFLIRYIGLSFEERQRFISQHFPKDDGDIGGAVLEIGLPPNWLDEETRFQVRANMLQMLAEPISQWTKRQQLTIIPHLGQMKEAAESGWLDESFIRGRIANLLDIYLKRKSRPAGQAVLALLYGLPVCLVPPELYAQVASQAIKDLRLRKCPKEAEEWLRKFQESGIIES